MEQELKPCPICGCLNPAFDPAIALPTTFEELLVACDAQDADHRQKEQRHD